MRTLNLFKEPVEAEEDIRFDEYLGEKGGWYKACSSSIHFDKTLELPRNQYGDSYRYFLCQDNPRGAIWVFRVKK